MAGMCASRESSLTVLAPAKINLTLEVLAERPDGFHEIRSVVQVVSLCDRLCFRPGKDIEFSCDSPDWVAGQSLVPKAIGLLRETTGCTRGAVIEIEKRIPLLAGLGGDSSDAAAALLGLDRLWGLALLPTELASLASQMGSDVAFFLHGGTALVEGRGEVVTPLAPLPRMWVVLMVPPVPKLPGKTARLYASLRPNHCTDGRITEKFIGAPGEFEPSMLFNTFENVAFDQFSGLRVYKEHLIKLGVPNVHLAGSGPTLYTMLREVAEAQEIYQRLKDAGLECYLAETLASC